MVLHVNTSDVATYIANLLFLASLQGTLETVLYSYIPRALIAETMLLVYH